MHLSLSDSVKFSRISKTAQEWPCSTLWMAPAKSLPNSFWSNKNHKVWECINAPWSNIKPMIPIKFASVTLLIVWLLRKLTKQHPSCDVTLSHDVTQVALGSALEIATGRSNGVRPTHRQNNTIWKEGMKNWNKSALKQKIKSLKQMNNEWTKSMKICI